MPPPESNKRIEELLKSYSRKRRDQLQPGLELHPASRKALLLEASHAAPAASASPGSFQKVMEWWRWFFVGAIAVWVVGLCLYIEMPPPPAQIKPVPALEVRRSRAVMAPIAKNLPEQYSKSAAESHAVANATPPPVPVAAPASLPSGDLASQLVRKVRTADAIASKDQEKAENSDALAPQANRQKFVQMADRSQYRENVQSPPLPKLLRSFEVERTGNKVRVTDADGSVYAGEVVESTDKTPGEFSFRVTGTSDYLNQNVTLTGKVSQNAAIGGFAGATRQSIQQNRALFSGQVQVGTGDEFQMRAVPAP